MNAETIRTAEAAFSRVTGHQINLTVLDNDIVWVEATLDGLNAMKLEVPSMAIVGLHDGGYVGLYTIGKAS